MYTISRAAEMLGVPAATLRAWQRRYRVVAPKRTEAGYRLYDDADLDTLREMQRLIDDGWSPRQAAQAVRAWGPNDDVEVSGHADAGVGGDLVQAAKRLDGAAATRLLDERLARGPFEQVVDEWLLPQLQRLGASWAAGEVSVAGEHIVAAAVQRRLSALYDLSGTPDRPTAVVTGLPAGSRHELGMLCFAVAASRQGLAVVHLGAGLPDEDWAAAVRVRAARAAVLSAPTPQDVPPAVRLVRLLCSSAVLVGVGGRCQQAVHDGCTGEVAGRVEWLGHRIGPAAARIAALLAEPSDVPGAKRAG